MIDVNRFCIIIITLWIFVIHMAQGVINMQGCTEAFFRMRCPDDDILKVYDVRFSEVDDGHPCAQREPEDAIIPNELTEQCLPNNKSKDGRLLCSYLENICEGKTECVFYISPHLISGKETPTVNSEVIIKYECMPGKKRKTEIGAVSFVAVFSICSLLIVGGLLLWRQLTHNPSDYAVSTDQPIPGHSLHSPEPSSHYVSQGAAAESSVISDDQVPVELRTTTSGISHIHV